MTETVEPKPIKPLRILVVEDNFLVAMSIERALARRGCHIVGPVATVIDGRRLAEETDLDGAILDVNIRGGTSEPIAEALEHRGLPFIFITGYGSPMMLPERLRRVQRLGKPIDAGRLIEAVDERFTHDPLG